MTNGEAINWIINISADIVVRFVYTATKSSREYWQRCAKAWMPLPEPYEERRER